MREIREYPWHALERVARFDARAAGRARRLLEGAGPAHLDALGRALTELVGAEIEIVVRSLGRARRPKGAHEVVLAIADALTIGVSLEPDAAVGLLSRVLGRQVKLDEPELALSNPLSGALAALACEAARRVVSEPVRLGSPPVGLRAFELDLTLLVDGRPYAAAARVWADSVEPELEVDVARLGQSRLELPLVVALSWAKRSELESLHVGDAWFPGEGWLIQRSLSGRAALAAPCAERGAWVDLAQDGTVVLREGSAELVFDASPEKMAAEPMTASEGSPQKTLGEVALEAPVVVRVELGSVSLSARDLATLKPGDVLETRQRIGEPVVLRVGGRAVARGDLVDVEGELGVRIRELVEGAP